MKKHFWPAVCLFIFITSPVWGGCADKKTSRDEASYSKQEADAKAAASKAANVSSKKTDKARPAKSAAPKEKPYAWSPSLKTAGAKQCTVSEPVLLGAHSQKRLRSLAVNFGPNGGLAAWYANKDSIKTVSLETDGRPRGTLKTAKLSGARSNLEIIGLGDRFGVSAHDLCPDDRLFRKCIEYITVDGQGDVVGQPSFYQTQEWIQTELMTRVSSDTVFLGWGYTYIPPEIAELTLLDKKTARLSVVHVGSSLAEDFPVLYGLTASKSAWYALARDNLDRSNIGIRLFSKDGPMRPLSGLPEPITVHHMSLAPSKKTISVVFSPMSGKRPLKPRFVQFDLNGKLQQKPKLLTSLSQLPTPIDTFMTYEVKEKKGRLSLRRSDAAGNIVGDVPIASASSGPRDHPQVDAAWNGKAFVIVYSTFEKNRWSIYSVQASCAPGTDGE